MKKRMAKLVALSMTALMAASLTACGGDSGNASSSETSGEDKSAKKEAGDDGSKEIVYWNIGTESPDKDVIAKAVDKFNSETESGYTVTVVPTQNDTYKEKLVVAISWRMPGYVFQLVRRSYVRVHRFRDSASPLIICSMRLRSRTNLWMQPLHRLHTTTMYMRFLTRTFLLQVYSTTRKCLRNTVSRSRRRLRIWRISVRH